MTAETITPVLVDINVVHNNNSEMLYFGNMADWKWECDNKPGFCTPMQWAPACPLILLL